MSRRFMLDYDPTLKPIAGIAGGPWTLLIDGERRLYGSRQQCLDHAKKNGATFRDVGYTPRARGQR